MQVYLYQTAVGDTAVYASLFKESDHPRDAIGEFTAKTGLHPVSSGPKKPSKKPAAEQETLFATSDQGTLFGKQAPKVGTIETLQPAKHDRESKTLTGQQVLNLVKQSPNLASKDIDWSRHADRFGIEGDFSKGTASVADLKRNLDFGYLRMSNTVDPQTVSEKATSGKLNPIIISKEPGRQMVVVDGNHSLQAAIKRGDAHVSVIVSDKIKSQVLTPESAEESKTESPLDAEVVKQAAPLPGQKAMTDLFDRTIATHSTSNHKALYALTSRLDAAFAHYGLAGLSFDPETLRRSVEAMRTRRDSPATKEQPKPPAKKPEVPRTGSGRDRWITIGAKNHHGGTPVKIDGEGNIKAGPDAIEGKNVAELPDRKESENKESDTVPAITHQDVKKFQAKNGATNRKNFDHWVSTTVKAQLADGKSVTMVANGREVELISASGGVFQDTSGRLYHTGQIMAGEAEIHFGSKANEEAHDEAHEPEATDEPEEPVKRHALPGWKEFREKQREQETVVEPDKNPDTSKPSGGETIQQPSKGQESPATPGKAQPVDTDTNQPVQLKVRQKLGNWVAEGNHNGRIINRNHPERDGAIAKARADVEQAGGKIVEPEPITYHNPDDKASDDKYFAMEHAKAHAEVAAAHKALAQAQDKHAEHQAHIEKLTSDLDAYQKHVGELKAELEAGRAKRKELEERAKAPDLQKLKKDAESHRADIEQLKKEAAEHRAKGGKLRRKADESEDLNVYRVADARGVKASDLRDAAERQISIDSEHWDTLRNVLGSWAQMSPGQRKMLAKKDETKFAGDMEEMRERAEASGIDFEAAKDALKNGMPPKPSLSNPDYLEQVADAMGRETPRGEADDSFEPAATSPDDNVPFSLAARGGLIARYARQFGEAMAQYALKPAAGQKSMGWDEQDHPRGQPKNAGQFTANAGDVFHIPEMKSAHGPRSAFNVKVHKFENGQAHVGYGDSQHVSAVMPQESLKHFVNDLSGKVDVPANSGNHHIDQVSSGKAEFLGKGDDSLVFKSGDKVVKVSTTVPFQPFNPGHRTPEQARQMAIDQFQLAKEIHLAGVPGIPHQSIREHGDKAFTIREHLTLPDKMTSHQLDQVRSMMVAMHRAGFAINDEIQVGVGNDGQIYHFDLGKAGKIGENKYANEDENSNLERLYRKHGREHEFTPFGEQAQRRLEHFSKMSDNKGFADKYEHTDPHHIEHWKREAQWADAGRRGMLKDHPDLAGEINRRFTMGLERVGMNPSEFGLTPTPKPQPAPAPKPAGQAPGVAGAQMGLFGQTGAGQKQLFNVALPSKKTKPKSMFEPATDTVSPLDELKVKQEPALVGQKAIFELADHFNRALYSYRERTTSA